MSITFRQAEAGRTGTTRTINSISGNQITLSGALAAGTAVGDVLELFSTGGAGNDGFYTIIELPTTSTPKVRPTPNATSGGSAARLTRLTSRTVSGAGTITSVTAIANNLAVVQVNGANFRANDIRRNDRLIVSGSSTTANNGGWYVQAVLDEDQLVARAPDGGAGMSTEAVGTGSISIRFGNHLFEIVAESSLSFPYIRSNAVPKTAPTNKFGSGEARDYIRSGLVGGDSTNRTMHQIEGAQFSIDQSTLGAPSSFSSLNEIVVNMTPGARGTAITQLTPTANNWGSANPLTITIGNRPGDRYSADQGCAWIGLRINGFNANAKIATNLYGSYFDVAPGGVQLFLFGGDAIASIVRESLATTTGLLESVIVYGGTALVSQGSGDQANILIASQVAATSFSVTSTAEGLIYSDAIAATSFTVNGAVVTIRNPRIDFNLSDHYSNISGSFKKVYTFNPRFVSRFFTGVAAEPVAGLLVTITEVNETDLTETPIFSDFTDANGRLNGGVGVDLKRQDLVGNPFTETNFTHRLVIEGAGFRRVDEPIQMTHIELGDRIVLRTAADYEGELSE